MPKRRNRRLKRALTVRRAILSCLAISPLSQPCSSSSIICRSRGPRQAVLSFMQYPFHVLRFVLTNEQPCRTTCPNDIWPLHVEKLVTGVVGITEFHSTPNANSVPEPLARTWTLPPREEIPTPPRGPEQADGAGTLVRSGGQSEIMRPWRNLHRPKFAPWQLQRTPKQRNANFLAGLLATCNRVLPRQLGETP